MIPRIFHWVWVGPNRVPDNCRNWIASWQRCHPGWSFRIWADQPECSCTDMPNWLSVSRVPPLLNLETYDSIENWITGKATIAARSDIVRYEVIARYGGIYLDTDVECFRPITELMANVSLFYFEEWGPSEGNYGFGATPNHPAMWTVVRELAGHVRSFKNNDGSPKAANAVEVTGPRYLGMQIRKHQDCVIFPYQIMNPLSAFDDPSMVIKWPDSAYGNHHYDGFWYDRVKNKTNINLPGAMLLAGSGVQGGSE